MVSLEDVRRIIGIIGIILILGPMISPLANSLSLYYQLTDKEITSNEYWKQVLPHLISLLTPTEVYIFNTFEKYGMYAVGVILIIFWGVTREDQNQIR